MRRNGATFASTPDLSPGAVKLDESPVGVRTHSYFVNSHVGFTLPPGASIIAVALDDQPLATSRRILLQVMSEERASGFETEAVNPTTNRIANIGRDPWQARSLSGRVSFKRTDAAQLKVTALDFNGQPVGASGTAQEIKLRPETLHYLIAP